MRPISYSQWVMEGIERDLERQERDACVDRARAYAKRHARHLAIFDTGMALAAVALLTATVVLLIGG